MGIAHLKSQLRKQSELLSEFGKKELDLQKAILERNWPAMDSVMPDLERLSATLESVERRRHSVVVRMKAAVGLEPDAPFAELVLQSKFRDRAELTSLYRDLQIAVLRVKNQTSGIDSYVRNSVRTANTVLGELFPERKGTIYSRSGAHSPAHGSAMVLNHEL
jgi:flagellar FlgN protein